MKKKLTSAELLAYIQEKGEPVLATTTEVFHEIPAITQLWFGETYATEYITYISSFDVDTKYKNQNFDYSFDYKFDSSWHDSYKGKFMVEMPEEQSDRPFVYLDEFEEALQTEMKKDESFAVLSYNNFFAGLNKAAVLARKLAHQKQKTTVTKQEIADWKNVSVQNLEIKD